MEAAQPLSARSEAKTLNDKRINNSKEAKKTLSSCLRVERLIYVLTGKFRSIG